MRARIAFLALAFCAGAHAAVDCGKQTLAADETLTEYLLGYGAECVEPRAKPVIDGWRLSPGEPNAHQVIPAWLDVAERFRAAGRAPQSEIAAAAGQLAERAARAADSIRSDASNRSAAGAVFYGNVAWRYPPSLSSAMPDASELLLPALPTGEGVIDLQAAADRDCREKASALCARALADAKELLLAWRLASQVSFGDAAAAIGRIGDRVAGKKALWDRYLYQSKPMLPLDFIATDFLDNRWEKSDQYPDGFREPPDTQYFLLHPSVAVEQLSGAEDGQQLKPVLVLEILGANRWREDRRWIDAPALRHLSGASLAVSYADRAGVRDTGVGILLTFDNVYTLGVMRYESKTGLLFSLDLANMFRDRYRERYESFRSGVKNKLF